MIKTIKDFWFSLVCLGILFSTADETITSISQLFWLCVYVFLVCGVILYNYHRVIKKNSKTGEDN